MTLDEIALSRLSPLAREAWACSFLAGVSDDVEGQLLEHVWEWRLESGQIFYRGAHHANMAMLGIVASGRLRIFVRSADGRQATVRYADTGAVIGLPAALSEGCKIDGEVIDDALVARLSPRASPRSRSAKAGSHISSPGISPNSSLGGIEVHLTGGRRSLGRSFADLEHAAARITDVVAHRGRRLLRPGVIMTASDDVEWTC